MLKSTIRFNSFAMPCFAPPVPTLGSSSEAASLADEPEISSSDVGKLIDARASTIQRLFASVGTDDAWKVHQELQLEGLHLKIFVANASGLRGPFVIAHAEIPNPEVDADALFRWLVSVAGFKVIDPDTKNHESPPVDNFTGTAWRDRAETTYAVAPPLMKLVDTRTFMVLNAMDHTARLFISTPISHPQHPKAKEASLKQVRARNVWGSLVEPRGGGGCIMKSLCWTHLGGSFPECLTDKFMTEQYMPMFHKRMAEALKTQASALKKQPASTSAGGQAPGASGAEAPVTDTSIAVMA